MYRSVVVGTDGSPTARKAVEHAAAICSSTGAPLHLVTVERPASMSAGASPEAAMWMGAVVASAVEASEAIRQEMETVAERVRADGVEVKVHVRQGDPADSLVEIADLTKSDLIVVGSRGMHGARRLIGSVPNKVSHRASTSVLIVRTE